MPQISSLKLLPMRLGKSRKRFETGEYSFEISRTTGGVIELWGEDDFALAAGTGFAHMHDRAVQMMLVRAIGHGRVCELLGDSEESLHIDLAIRSLDFRDAALKDVPFLSDVGMRFAEAYATGVNHYLAHHRLPLEFKLLRWTPDPWQPADCLLCIHLMSYLGLAQSQQDAEKFIIQAVRGGAPLEMLKYLFAPHLEELTPETVELLKQVKLHAPLLRGEAPFLTAVPSVTASNNWAVAGSRSRSGHALECHDPHLESNRLPPVWAELVMHTPDNYRIGVNMPGLPGIAMGRTRDISTGFTYGYMDMVDYFIEDCRDGMVRDGIAQGGDEYIPLKKREETIKRRKSPDVHATYWETSRGVLELDAQSGEGKSEELPNGLYLARAFARQPGGAARSLEALYALMQAPNVAAAQETLKNVNISANWVIADSSGAIGYQQSGTLPDRAGSGLAPQCGWRPEAQWRGFVSPDRFLRINNPPEGFLHTANEELNPQVGPLAVNLHHGFDRSDRIKELLEPLDQASLADMKRIQNDLYSKHAERFLAAWQPLIDVETPAAELLLEWDLCYTLESRAATLFEAVYVELAREVLGHRGFGEEAWQEIVVHSGLLALFYTYFDRPLLRAGNDFDETFWYGDAGWERVTRTVVNRVLAETDVDQLPTWGQRQQIVMKNILLGERLPRFARFDHGPVSLPGCRATIVQSVIYESHNRKTNHFPSYRAVTDMGAHRMETASGGGPSGRAWSRLYRTDIPMWLAGEYKELRAE